MQQTLHNEPAVRLKSVSKRYRLYSSQKDRLKAALDPFGRKFHNDFWALQDISFEIQKGQTFGIVGKNGSGKSTLLQILASVLQPTHGTIEVSGRTAALLELGAGFNPEFTGRENAIFHGILNGLSRDESLSKIEAIREFADIGEFFDQPVKLYSTGMFVRVAFASAINVDPEILIIDEALAVGDAKFQHKCYKKFSDLQQAGTTIILVTHDTNAVAKHCDQALLLDRGQHIITAEPETVIKTYNHLLFSGQSLSHKRPNANSQSITKSDDKDRDTESILSAFLLSKPTADCCMNHPTYNETEHRIGDKTAEIVDYLIETEKGIDPITCNSNEVVSVYVKCYFKTDIARPVIGITLKTLEGIIIYGFNNLMVGQDIGEIPEKTIATFKITLPLKLRSGDYFLDIGVASREASIEHLLDLRQSMIHLRINPTTWFDGVFNFEANIELKSADPAT